WESRRSGPGRPDAVEVIARAEGGHGGADPSLIAEFLDFVRHGGVTDVSAVAAREAVATGVYGAESIRSGGTPYDVPPVPEDLRRYFDDGQAGGGQPHRHLARVGAERLAPGSPPHSAD